MAPHTQAKILRLIQEGRLERVGGNETISVDVRILAATNQDLDSLIGKGQFRKDLYYRLSGVTIPLPPLRNRQEDIPELAHYFLFRYNRQLGTSVQSIAPESLELLQSYPWPGNVRELQNVLRQALITSAGATVLPEFLPNELHEQSASEAEEHIETQIVPDNAWQTLQQNFTDWLASGETDLYRRARERFDRLIILGAMQHAGGNRSQAGKILGLSQVTLRARLRSMASFLRCDLGPQGRRSRTLMSKAARQDFPVNFGSRVRELSYAGQRFRSQEWPVGAPLDEAQRILRVDIDGVLGV